MLIIPTAAVASQTFNVVLGAQSCTINLYQKSELMFCDLLVSAVVVMSGVICRDRVRLVRQKYLDFNGDLVFIDQQGTSDPIYTGLGSQFCCIAEP
jgi:hypothetical protein